MMTHLLFSNAHVHMFWWVLLVLLLRAAFSRVALRPSRAVIRTCRLCIPTS